MAPPMLFLGESECQTLQWSPRPPLIHSFVDQLQLMIKTRGCTSHPHSCTPPRWIGLFNWTVWWISLPASQLAAYVRSWAKRLKTARTLVLCVPGQFISSEEILKPFGLGYFDQCSFVFLLQTKLAFWDTQSSIWKSWVRNKLRVKITAVKLLGLFVFTAVVFLTLNNTVLEQLNKAVRMPKTTTLCSPFHAVVQSGVRQGN